MPELVSIQPVLPTAPAEYSRKHQNEIQRSIDILFGMLRNPGEILATTIGLTNVADSPTGLRVGSAYKNGSSLHIAPAVASKEAYTAVTAAYTVLANDYVVDCTSAPYTVTLPTAIGVQGQVYVIKNSGTGTITVDGDGSETIDGSASQTLPTQYDSLRVMSNGANWLVL